MSDLSHVYGCEHEGCTSTTDTATRVWCIGFGWVWRYLCLAHVGGGAA